MFPYITAHLRSHLSCQSQTSKYNQPLPRRRGTQTPAELSCVNQLCDLQSDCKSSNHSCLYSVLAVHTPLLLMLHLSWQRQQNQNRNQNQNQNPLLACNRQQMVSQLS
jgi:hypothetical protein